MSVFRNKVTGQVISYDVISQTPQDGYIKTSAGYIHPDGLLSTVQRKDDVPFLGITAIAVEEYIENLLGNNDASKDWSVWDLSDYWSGIVYETDPSWGQTFTAKPLAKTASLVVENAFASPLIIGMPHVFSVYLKSNRRVVATAKGKVYNAASAAGIESAAQTITLSPNWQRFYFIMTPTDGSVCNSASITLTLNDVNIYVSAAKPQIEVGIYPSSYTYYEDSKDIIIYPLKEDIQDEGTVSFWGKMTGDDKDTELIALSENRESSSRLTVARRSPQEQLIIAGEEPYSTIETTKPSLSEVEIYGDHSAIQFSRTGETENVIGDTLAASGEPRYKDGGVLIEEGTTNLIPVSKQKFANWTAYEGAVITLTQNQTISAWGTSQATRVQTSGGTANLKYHVGVGTSEDGQPYSLSVFVSVPTGKPTVKIKSNVGGAYMEVAAGETKEVILPNNIGNGVTVVILSIETLNAADNLEFYAWRPQIEKKPICTTFTSITRNAETMSVPKENLSPDKGTIDIIWEVDSNVHNANKGYASAFTIVDPVIGETNQISLGKPNGSSSWNLYSKSSSTLGAVSLSTPANGKHILSFAWDKIDGGKVYLDGVYKGTITTDKLPESFDLGSLCLGVWRPEMHNLNSPIYDFRVSSIARPESEILAYHTSQNLPKDEYTTFKLDIPFSKGIDGVDIGGNGIVVENKGKNIFDFWDVNAAAGGTYYDFTHTGIRVYNTSAVSFRYVNLWVKAKPGTFTLSTKVTVVSGQPYIYAYAYDINKVRLSITTYFSKYAGAGNWAITSVLPEHTAYVLINFHSSASTSEIGDVTYSDIQLEEGSVVTTYAPPQPYKLTIDESIPLLGKGSSRSKVIGRNAYISWWVDTLTADANGEITLSKQASYIDAIENTSDNTLVSSYTYDIASNIVGGLTPDSTYKIVYKLQTLEIIPNVLSGTLPLMEGKNHIFTELSTNNRPTIKLKESSRQFESNIGSLTITV